MSVYFLDSSALTKCYITETGSDWIRTLTAPESGNLLVIARITWVEVLGAFARRQREGLLSPPEMQRAIQLLRYDMNMQYQVIELDEQLAEDAGTLITHHALRAYDAVQLAAALRIENRLAHIHGPSLTFLVADTRLANIAQAEGMQTDNPNHH